MRKPALSEKQLKFVREVGSVVLGVLIALGIGEIAEAVRWKIRVDNSMRPCASKSRATVEPGRARRLQPCLDRRLEAIGPSSPRRSGESCRGSKRRERRTYRMIDTAAFEVA